MKSGGCGSWKGQGWLVGRVEGFIPLQQGCNAWSSEIDDKIEGGGKCRLEDVVKVEDGEQGKREVVRVARKTTRQTIENSFNP